jgi:hypothetical protein
MYNASTFIIRSQALHGAWEDDEHMYLHNSNGNSLEQMDRVLFILHWKGPIPKAEGLPR